MHYTQAKFTKSAAKLTDLPPDNQIEVAFAGRSNAGKSSALNKLTQRKGLARTSKTPGRTQLINFFSIAEGAFLVDLPGYGYAKVPEAVKLRWQETLAQYLRTRQSLKGLVLVMDIRHPLKEMDLVMLSWAVDANLAVHCLLTKADKLSQREQHKQLKKVEEALLSYGTVITAQCFSSSKGTGREALIQKLDEWF